MLLIERADAPGYWQSVTGSQEPGETLAATAARELREETGIDAAAYGGARDWQMSNVYEIYPRWRHRYRAGHDAQHRARVLAGGARARAGDAGAARASGARLAALAGGRGEVLLVVEPRRDPMPAANAPRAPRLSAAQAAGPTIFSGRTQASNCSSVT